MYDVNRFGCGSIKVKGSVATDSPCVHTVALQHHDGIFNCFYKRKHQSDRVFDPPSPFIESLLAIVSGSMTGRAGHGAGKGCKAVPVRYTICVG